MVTKKKRKERKKVRSIRASQFEPSDVRFSTSGTVELKAADGEDKANSFEITAYNGGSLSLPGFEAPVYVDCSKVQVHGNAAQQPILRDHSVAKTVGHGRPVVNATNLEVKEGALSHDNEHSREIISASQKGFSWQASIGGKTTARPRLIKAGNSTHVNGCLLYTSPSPRDRQKSRMPSSA